MGVGHKVLDKALAQAVAGRLRLRRAPRTLSKRPYQSSECAIVLREVVRASDLLFSQFKMPTALPRFYGTGNSCYS